MILAITYSFDDIRDIIAGAIFEILIIGVPLFFALWFAFHAGVLHERRKNKNKFKF